MHHLIEKKFDMKDFTEQNIASFLVENHLQSQKYFTHFKLTLVVLMINFPFNSDLKNLKLKKNV